MREETLQLIPQKYKKFVRDHYEKLYTPKTGHLEEMDKFLKTNQLPRLNHQEREN